MDAKHYIDRIKIVENCFSEQFVSFIEEQLSATTLNWTYARNLTYPHVKAVKPGFNCSAFSNDQILNSAYWFLYPLLLESANKNGFFVEKLIRILISAHTNKDVSSICNIHKDKDEHHLVALYYPFDSDGDTVFFDNILGTNEVFRFTPKRGSMLFFDGAIYHAASYPVKNDIRMVVNFNFFGKSPFVSPPTKHSAISNNANNPEWRITIL